MISIASRMSVSVCDEPCSVGVSVVLMKSARSPEKSARLPGMSSFWRWSSGMSCLHFGGNEELERQRSTSRLLPHHLPADQPAADLARAGADLVELGIAQQAAGRIVVDVAVAAEKLDCVERCLRRLFRRVEDAAGRVLACCLLAVACRGHCIDIGPAGVHRRVHVGQLALDELELAD